MMNTLEIIDILWARLDGSQLKTQISGGIFKGQRPINSQKEDVVINCLPVNNTQLQNAVANVNIHVPNLVLAINGAQDDTQPDHARILELTALAVTILTDVWAGDYNFDVQQQVVFQDEDARSHYSNIRIEFNNINISN